MLHNLKAKTIQTCCFKMVTKRNHFRQINNGHQSQLCISIATTPPTSGLISSALLITAPPLAPSPSQRTLSASSYSRNRKNSSGAATTPWIPSARTSHTSAFDVFSDDLTTRASVPRINPKQLRSSWSSLNSTTDLISQTVNRFWVISITRSKWILPNIHHERSPSWIRPSKP